MRLLKRTYVPLISIGLILVGWSLFTPWAANRSSDELVGAKTEIRHLGPDYLYPDPTKTPCKADTLDLKALQKSYNGKTYSQAHRNVSEAKKKEVRKLYMFFNPPEGGYEIDHCFPVSAGGSNDVENLWPQPAENYWDGKRYGFHEKDQLEAWGAREIKASRLDPKDFYRCVVSDWVACYQANIKEKEFGSAEIGEPGELESD
jgi:hypothetical protein